VVAALAGEFKAVLEEGSSSVRESVAVQKVLRDFEAALRKAEAMLKETRRRQGQHAARVRVVAASPQTTAQTTAQTTHAVPTQQTQAVHTLHHELEANEAVIRDRDAALAQISSQIGDVHQIFVDLAGLVSDQGGQVDDIESNIERAKQRTEDGIGQIRRAERKGKRARCNVFFMTGLAGMAVLVLMIVVLA
jgi:syntaxin 7